MFSSSRINRAGSHFLLKGFGFLAVALSFSMAEAGPRKPTKPVAVDDVWTPQAVSAFNAQQDAFRKTAAGAKAATDFFVPEVLASDLGNIKYAVTADVNNDGWPDVVYAAEFSNEFGIFLNNQTSPATFTRQVLSSNERGASFIVARDLNQDERVDLVLASRFSGTISVWLNAGGGFTPTFERDDVGNVRNASQVEVGHFNNDGALDLVVPSPETSSLVFLLQQPGEQVTFGAPPVELNSLEFERFTYAAKNGRPTFVRSIQDTDGPESLVVNYRNSNTVFVFSNLLSTELEPVEPLQAKGAPIVTPDFFEFQLDSVRRPQAIEIADMNDFGFNEIIIAGEAADEIIIYSFDSFFIDQPFPQSPVAKGRIIEQPVTPEYQKTWVTANFEAANRPNVGYADRPFSVVAADINHDDRLDLLVPGWGNNRFLWYEQLYNNFYDDAPEADLNEKEIIFPNGYPFLFHARSVSRAYNTPRHMVAGDFNQDGCMDIVGTAQLDNSLILFTGKGFNVPGDNPSFTIVTPENGSTVFNENQTIITGEYSFNDKNPFAHDFMLLLDFSASTNFENNFEEIRTAALEFLYSLPYENVSAAPEAKGAEKGYNYYELYDIQVGIILFRDTPEIALPLSFNVPAAISFLQNLEPTSLSNFTNIHDAINLGIQELSEKGQENSHRALYLISDGVQTQLDGWIAADASPYQIHTYSTGLPLFSLPFPDPALVEIGGGELLQDIAFITGGNHAWGQDWLYFSELRIPNFFIDYIYMDVFFETTPGNFVYNNSYYPPYYNFDFGTFDQLVNSNLTEEGDLATKVIARMYLDGNGKGSELVAETTYYAEINVGPETPTAKPVLHAAVNLPTTDADGDEVFYKGYWSSSNGEGPINFGPTSETEFILREADGYTFDDGETWYLILIACDDNGFESSQKYVLTFVIDLGVSMDILEP